MSQRISLLLSDVDGTLVTREKVLTERTRRAVADLRDAGIRFAITSGRPPKGMAMVIKPLAIDTPIAGFNGGLFTQPDLTPIEARKLPADVARALIPMIAAEGLDVWLYAGNDWLVRDAQAPHVAHEARTVEFAPQVVSDFGEAPENALKIVGVTDDREAIRRCADRIQATFGGRVTAATSQPYYLDITHPLASKGAVVDELARRLDIPQEEIATIGDGANDMSMFARSGFSVAMGQAAPDVKAAARAVTADCDSEGFAEAVATFILPRAKGRS